MVRILIIKDELDEPTYLIDQLRNMGQSVISSFVLDVDDNDQLMQKLRKSDARYRAVMEQTAEAIVLVDVDSHQILESNTAFFKLFGYPRQCIPGLTIYDLVANDRASVDENIEKLSHYDEVIFSERTYRCWDGSLLDVEIKGNLIAYEGGEVICLIIRDISQRKKDEELRRQAQEELERLAVAEERARLSRELHDSVAQALFSLTLFADSGKRFADSGYYDKVLQNLMQIYEIAHQSLKEMRLFIYELRPPILEKVGIIGAIRQRLNAVEQRSGVKTRFLVEDWVEIPPSFETQLFRIVQEALNNILKHAHAYSEEIIMNADSSQISLSIHDDGVGFDTQNIDLGGGMGLTTMIERAKQLGGSVDFISSPGCGTEVKIHIPINKKEG